MKTPLSMLPDLPTLTARLTVALGGHGLDGRPVRVVNRKLPRFMSTFPNEIVTCKLPNGRKRRVFVKYQGGKSHVCFGHRGDIPYEAEVYRRVLKALPNFRPEYLGAHTDPGTGDTALFLEYAHRNVRLSDIGGKRITRQPRLMAQAARWLGRFHADEESRVSDAALSFLKRYEAEYYRGWARRTFEFARPVQRRFPWLTELRRCGDAWFAPLLAAARTVIHGEFYAKTVLVRERNLFMVDWESAAIAAGEIDLAALTEGPGWPAKVVRRCEREYQRVRWPGGAPVAFDRTMSAARIYLHFRWLGDRPDWTIREKSLWRYDHLQMAAKQLGLV
jgi:hypothetical protein